MKKKRKGAPKKQWQDHYTRRARKEKYPARSVYKLQEMQQKYRIVRKGNRVLDLGCAPGSWLLFAAEQTGPGGMVIGIDLQKIDINLPPQAQAIQGDITETEYGWLEKIGREFDVVVSDMAPATTGNRAVDAARSYNLCQAALDIALKALKPGGTFVCKIFQGPDFKAFEQDVRNSFNKIKNFKPQSSRKASKELFIIGFGKKTPG
jgi:23S rRNA (uridine2552-2'-O)-methyltransferase